MMEFRNLKKEEIEVRISRVTSKSVSVLLYKDARCDMKILDETVGPENWQRNHEVINGNLFCNVGILTDNGWIWKQDVGVESYTEAQKGEASDSFKRACFNWGIGRELYTAPYITFTEGQCRINDNKCYDRFYVDDIEIEEKKIIKLRVVNKNTGSAFEYEQPAKIDAPKVNVIKNDIKDGLIDEAKLLASFKIAKIEDMTEKQFRKYAEQKQKKGTK